MNLRIVPMGDVQTNQEEYLEKMNTALGELLAILRKSSDGAVFLSTYCRESALWKEIAAKQHIKITAAPVPRERDARGRHLEESAHRDRVIATDLADLVLAFWDEDPDGSGNAVWQMLHKSIEKGVPCLWLSTKTGELYWAVNALYERYQPEAPAAYLESFLKTAEWDEAPEGKSAAQKVFLWFNSRYAALLKKYTPAGSAEPQADTLMEPDTKLSDSASESVRRKLMQQYRQYDDRAMRFSQLYRGTAYLRAWLPLFATAALAVAFYGDYFVKLLGGDGPKTAAAAYIIPSVFYLINAMFLWFTYFLAKNAGIQKWHENFLKNRMMSEILRFFVHVVPYGITMPVQSILKRSGFTEKRHASEMAQFRRILSQAAEDYPDYNEKYADEYLAHLADFLSNQLEYYRTSAERYRRISAHFSRIQGYVFKVGAGFVLIRGILQMIIGVQLSEHEDMLLKGFKNCTNMIAMVIPSIASYYAGKSALLGLSGGIAKAQLMQEQIEKALTIVNTTREHEVNYSLLRNLTEQIGILLLGNESAWEEEMSGKTVTTL